jgi:hypothetical protein
MPRKKASRGGRIEGEALAEFQNQTQEPHPDGDGKAEEGDHGGDRPAEVGPHIGSELAEFDHYLIDPPVDLLEAAVHVAPEVIKPLVDIVNPFG